MDAVKFIKELVRMCYADASDCKKCCYSDFCNKSPCDYNNDNILRVVNSVEEWSKNHPQKTWLDDFKEKFPKARFYKNGIPYISPYIFGYCDSSKCFKCKDNKKGCPCSTDCWDTPMEE